MQLLRHSLPVISVICGVLIILTGFTALFFYVATVIDSFQQPDNSLIFRYIPFAILGSVLLIAGFWYVASGVKAFQDDYFYGLTKNSLGILVLIGILLAIVYILN